MVASIWVNIGSGNGLLPDGAITWTDVDLSSVGFCGMQLWTISQEVLKNLIRNMNWKITILKLLPHLSGTNELITGGFVIL